MDNEIPPALRGVHAPDALHPSAIGYETGLPLGTIETDDGRADQDPTIAVEQLLDEHAGFFQAAEELWDEVKSSSEVLSELLSAPRIPTYIHDEDGRAKPALVPLEHGGREDVRFVKQRRGINVKQLLGKINQDCFDRVAASSEVFDVAYTKFDHTDEMVVSISQRIAQSMEQAREQVKAERGIKPEIAGVENLSEAEKTLRLAYMAAFGGQYFVNQKLEDIFADDHYAPALLEHLEDLAAIGQNAPQEYPGLLQVPRYSYCSVW